METVARRGCFSVFRNHGGGEKLLCSRRKPQQEQRYLAEALRWNRASTAVALRERRCRKAGGAAAAVEAAMAADQRRRTGVDGASENLGERGGAEVQARRQRREHHQSPATMKGAE